MTIARTTGLQAALDSKQALLQDGSLTIARTTGLQAALDSKQDLLSDLPGTGVTLMLGNQMRRLFGHGGVAITQHLELADPNDPSNFQIRVSGEALQTAIATLQQQVSAISTSTSALPSAGPATFTGALSVTDTLGDKQGHRGVV